MDKDQPSRKDRQSKLDPKNKKHSTLSRRHRDANHPHAHQESFDSKSRHQRRLERIAQLEKRQGKLRQKHRYLLNLSLLIFYYPFCPPNK